MSKRLERDPANKMVGGVCAGLATYLGVDPVLVRVFFVAAAFLGGSGFLAYLILLVVMPVGGGTPASSPGDAAREIEAAANEAGARVREILNGGGDHEVEQRRFGVGILLVILGALLLLSNSGILRLEPSLVWPVVVILAGVWLLLRRTRS